MPRISSEASPQAKGFLSFNWDEELPFLSSADRIIEPESLAPHLTDWRGVYHGKSQILFQPDTIEKLSRIMAFCYQNGIPMVPQGGNTGLVGGATPDDQGRAVLLSLRRLNRLRHIDPVNETMTVEAGMTLQEVQQAAQSANLYFPLSIGSQGSCQIGGNLATNAGGVNVLRYGSARNLVLGLEVVLPDGRIWNGLRGLRKDNCGYDLKQLFIGSEGTLGVITAAVLRLFPANHSKYTAFLSLDTPQQALDILKDLRELTDQRLSSFELIPQTGLEFSLKHISGTNRPLQDRAPWYVLFECGTHQEQPDLHQKIDQFLEKYLERGDIRDATIAQNLAQAESFWRLREALVEAQKFEGASFKHDVSVPISALAKFISDCLADIHSILPNCRPMPFGHLGDGNIHFNISQPLEGDIQQFLEYRPKIKKIIHDHAAACHGSISAEHGIGQNKREELKARRATLELDLMQQIKQSFDPKNLMNPGKVL